MKSTDLIDTLDALAREAPPGLRGDLAFLSAALRTPMADVLDRVPGANVDERCAALGISRQTYYVWRREVVRPSWRRAEDLERLTGIPAAAIAARGRGDGPEGEADDQGVDEDRAVLSRRAARTRAKLARLVVKQGTRRLSRKDRKRLERARASSQKDR